MIRAATIMLLLTANLALWGTPIILLGVVKLFLPDGPMRRRLILLLARMGEGWVSGNSVIFDAMLPTKWEVEGTEGLRADGHYLVISNHVSWVDIFALFRVLHRKTALLRFFLKKELIWMPFAGQAAWALEFPFMSRYSPEYLEKHPEKRGKDLETTRQACQRYRNIPAAILNFVEGTRFSQEKRADQDSPYRHLLRPRIGGIAFVLASLGDQLDAVLDVTLAYPRHDVTMWEFASGQVDRIVIRVRRIEVPPPFFDAAITVPGPARDRFKNWIETIWREKDELLDRIGT